MSASRQVKITLEIDTRKIMAAMRAMSRSVQQESRFRSSRPVSRERLDIAKLGREEMAEAIAWFNNNLEATS